MARNRQNGSSLKSQKNQAASESQSESDHEDSSQEKSEPESSPRPSTSKGVPRRAQNAKKNTLNATTSKNQNNGNRHKTATLNRTEEEPSDAEESDGESANEEPQAQSNVFHRVTGGDHVLDWAKQGLFEVPSIRCFDEPKKRKNDQATSELGPMLTKLIMMFHHKKEPFTKLQLRKKFITYNKDDDFEEALETAHDLLLEDFGFVLVEIHPGEPIFTAANDRAPSSQAPSGSSEEATQKSRKTPGVTYILINTCKPEHSMLNCAKRDHAYLRKSDPKEDAKLTALSLILLYIFMEGGWVIEDQLIVFLRLFGFDWDATHPLVGSVKSMFTTFSKQEYLVKEKFMTSMKVTCAEAIRYKWGARADLEFSRLGMIEMCGKVLGATADVDHFGERYNNAVSVEGRRLAKINGLMQTR